MPPRRAAGKLVHVTPSGARRLTPPPVKTQNAPVWSSIIADADPMRPSAWVNCCQSEEPTLGRVTRKARATAAPAPRGELERTVTASVRHHEKPQTLLRCGPKASGLTG